MDGIHLTTMEHCPYLPFSRHAIEARLQHLRSEPDGIIHTEPAGVHFLVVRKSGPTLTFLLVEQSSPSSSIIQSELDLDDPLQLVDPYTQAMALGLMWDPEPRTIYIAGLGGGRLPLVLRHYIPGAMIDCVEIDPAVASVAITFFGLLTDSRLKIMIDDGRAWLETNQQQYDLMLIDVFLDNGYSPYKMTTVEFYRLCRSRLGQRGVIAVNVLDGDRYINSRLNTIRTVFDYAYVCEIADENYVILASMAPPALHLRYGDIAAEVSNRYKFRFPFAIHAQSLTQRPDFLDADAEQQPLFYDTDPPDDYFDDLPRFDSAFSNVDPELPCPCGSGERFADCHGYSPGD